MTSKIQLVGLDIDGTLMTRDHRISRRNKAAITTCLDKGCQVYLITGRPYCFAKQIALQIDERIRVVAYNGGLYETLDQIQEYPIEEQALRNVADQLQEAGARAFFKGRRVFYTHEPYDYRFLYDHENSKYPEALQVHSYTELDWSILREAAHDILKVLVYHPQPAVLNRARKKILALQSVEVTDYQDISFDINACQVNKGAIIQKILQELDISKDAFMAIGDSNNDIAMFEQAGWSVAMGNANQQIKQLCCAVTDDVERDGVAAALELYV